MKILITGASGFIGRNLKDFLSKFDYDIYTLDIVSDGCIDFVCDIRKYDKINKIFKEHQFDKVIHLAAKAGVRRSGIDPYIYLTTNIIGFNVILDACARNNVKQLIYASSSSVYGNIDGENEDAKCDEQVSVYAVTKKENENMAYAYSHNYGIKTTGLRFFSVFGKWMRDDLAIHKFTRRILNGDKIEVYGDGLQERDYTPVMHICKYIKYLIDNDQENAYEIYNIGSGSKCPVSVNELIKKIEDITGIEANVEYMSENKQDVKRTCADDTKIRKLYDPEKISFDNELKKFIDWMI